MYDKIILHRYRTWMLLSVVTSEGAYFLYKKYGPPQIRFDRKSRLQDLK